MSWLTTLGRWFTGRPRAGGDPRDPFWFNPIGWIRPVSAGVRVDEHTAMTYSAVWAATRALSISAVLPLEVFQGDDDVRTEKPLHPVARLWNKRPNRRMTASAFRGLLMRWQINAGNAYADLSEPGEMWPIHPSRVFAVDFEGNPVDAIASDGYRYRVRNDDGSHFDFEPEEILHVPSIMSEDGVFGKGVIAHARETVGFGLATERYGANWFGKGGIPRVVIEQPADSKPLQPEERNQFRAEWQSIYGGPDGDKVALLRGAKPHLLNISAEDSQFLQTRQHNVEEVARWYGVPPHMIGHLLKATFNNIEHLGIEFVRYSLRPWQVAIEQEIEAKQLGERARRDHYVEHDATDLLRGDSNSFADFLVKLKDSGILGRDEARRRMRLPPAAQVDDDFTMRGATPSGDGPPPNEDADADADEDTGDEEARAVALAWLGDVLGRANARDANAARKAAKQPKGFVAWVEDWTTSSTVEEMLSPIPGVRATAVAGWWCHETREQLLEVAGAATADNLATKVAALVESSWADRVTRFLEEHRDGLVVDRADRAAAAA